MVDSTDRTGGDIYSNASPSIKCYDLTIYNLYITIYILTSISRSVISWKCYLLDVHDGNINRRMRLAVTVHSVLLKRKYIFAFILFLHSLI